MGVRIRDQRQIRALDLGTRVAEFRVKHQMYRPWAGLGQVACTI
jgi:hypothetical protein